MSDSELFRATWHNLKNAFQRRRVYGSDVVGYGVYSLVINIAARPVSLLIVDLIGVAVPLTPYTVCLSPILFELGGN